MGVRRLAGATNRLARGMRGRLALSFVVFFTLLLVALGFVILGILENLLKRQEQAILAEEWGALRGYLEVVNGSPVWHYDPEDPEQVYTLERLRRTLLLADQAGRVLHISPGYQAIGGLAAEELRETMRERKTVYRRKTDERGAIFTVRQGVLREGGRDYFLAIGYPSGPSREVLSGFAWRYYFWLPLLVGGSALLGWVLAGRALRPLHRLAAAAHSISGSNLSLRLKTSGSRDEVDGLILTFNSMLERLERNFEQMKQFAVDASHELRTPLTAMRGQLEVAMLTARDAGEYRRAMESALEDVERLSLIVKSLLALHQAESGRQPLELSTVDLSEIACAIVSHFEQPAAEKRVSLRTEVPLGIFARLDRAQVERLISNLVSNAVKYTHPGTEVRVALAERPGGVEIAVSDRGPGIPAQHLPHIFERFYRVPLPGDGAKGMGLGLTFVDSIVRAHGGAIEIRPREGGGTEFVVTLPQAAPAQPAATGLSGIEAT